MPEPTTTGDRRAALKERHRRAIVDAAAALMDETGGTQFTVDAIAERADVSRRTVFNHFASFEDVVTAVFTDVLGGVVEAFVATTAAAGATTVSAPGTADAAGRTAAERTPSAAMVDEVTAALRSTDLVGPMAYLTRTLRTDGDDHAPARLHLMLRAFTDMSAGLAQAVRARHSDVDPVDVDLLVAALAAGLMAIHRHWDAVTGAADDESSRQVWAGLVDRLAVRLRSGYADDPPSHQD